MGEPNEEIIEYFNRFGRSSLEGQVWVRGSNSLPWQQTILHTLYNLAELQEEPERQQLLDRAVIVTTAALSNAAAAVDKAKEKLGSMKQRINNMRHNAAQCPFEKFYSRALDFMQRRGSKIFELLKKGVKQRVEYNGIAYEEDLQFVDIHSSQDLVTFLDDAISEIAATRKDIHRRLKRPLCFRQQDIPEFTEGHLETEQKLLQYKYARYIAYYWVLFLPRDLLWRDALEPGARGPNDTYKRRVSLYLTVTVD